MINRVATSQMGDRDSKSLGRDQVEIVSSAKVIIGSNATEDFQDGQDLLQHGGRGARTRHPRPCIGGNASSRA